MKPAGGKRRTDVFAAGSGCRAQGGGRRAGGSACTTVLAAAITGLLTVWVLWDLFGARTANLRQFDPREVARLDTAMWRSYYDKERLKLFRQLAELLRKEYHLPFVRSHWAAYEAARAAFIFKEGQARSDYEKALPYLEDFYSAICKVSDRPFDVERAAKLELEWWIVHRERAKYPPETLQRLLAETSGVIYGMPSESFMEHGRLRAEAMQIRDSRAEAGGVSEEDWAQIAQLLNGSWQSLWQAVNPTARAAHGE